MLQLGNSCFTNRTSLSAEITETVTCLKMNEAPSILTAFKGWLEFQINKVPPQNKIGQAIQYMLRHWNELTNYLKDRRLEIDNNLIKNSIRLCFFAREQFYF